MYIKIVNDKNHFAINNPRGIVIHTGTRYFAAVLLQEYYEFWKYAFWFWLVPTIIAALAGLTLGFPYALIGLSTMLLVSLRVLPFNLHERELTGQAIEIAAIANFYGRQNMDSEYRMQARSMIRKDSPYKLRGYWPDIPAIDPNEYTKEMAIAGESHPSIDKMIERLKKKAQISEAYVQKHWAKLVKWRKMGDESQGY